MNLVRVRCRFVCVNQVGSWCMLTVCSMLFNSHAPHPKPKNMPFLLPCKP